MPEIIQGLVAYGWFGIAVFLFLLAYRLWRLTQGKKFIPIPDQGSPFRGWSSLQLTLLVLAVCVIAWPAFLYIFLFMREEPHV